jgi:hypothetical protein
MTKFKHHKGQTDYCSILIQSENIITNTNRKSSVKAQENIFVVAFFYMPNKSFIHTTITEPVSP